MKYVMKVVNALIAAAIFPAAYFLKLFFIQFGTNESAQPILQLLSPETPGVGVEESFSIHEIVQIIQGKHPYSNLFKNITSSSSFTWPEALDPLKGRLIAFVVCFVLCLLIALFVIIFSICSSKRLPVLLAGAAGLISAIVMITSFNSAAATLINDIPIGDIFATADGWLTNILLGFVGIDTLILGGFHSAFVIIYIGIIVWTGSFMIIEIGENNEEPEKKAKH